MKEITINLSHLIIESITTKSKQEGYTNLEEYIIDKIVEYDFSLRLNDMLQNLSVELKKLNSGSVFSMKSLLNGYEEFELFALHQLEDFFEKVFLRNEQQKQYEILYCDQSSYLNVYLKL